MDEKDNKGQLATQISTQLFGPVESPAQQKDKPLTFNPDFDVDSFLNQYSQKSTTQSLTQNPIQEVKDNRNFDGTLTAEQLGMPAKPTIIPGRPQGTQLPDNYDTSKASLSPEQQQWEDKNVLQKAGTGIKKGWQETKAAFFNTIADVMHTAATVGPLISQAQQLQSLTMAPKKTRENMEKAFFGGPNGKLKSYEETLAAANTDPTILGVKQKAIEKMEEAKKTYATGGWATFGEFFPFIVGSAASAAAAPFTEGTSLSFIPSMIGSATTGYVMVDSYGKAVQNYEQYTQAKDEYYKQNPAQDHRTEFEKTLQDPNNDLNKMAVGILSAAIVQKAGDILGVSGNAIKAGAQSLIGDGASTLLSANPKIAVDMLEKWTAESAMGKQFVNGAITVGKGALKSGGTFATMDVLQNYLDNIYKSPEDKAKFDEIVNSAVNSFKGGLYLGTFLGPIDVARNETYKRIRQNKNGINMVQTSDGNVYERVGKDPENPENILVIDPNGKSKTVKASDITDMVNVTKPELNQYLDAWKESKGKAQQVGGQIRANSVERSMTDLVNKIRYLTPREYLDQQNGKPVPESSGMSEDVSKVHMFQGPDGEIYFERTASRGPDGIYSVLGKVVNNQDGTFDVTYSKAKTADDRLNPVNGWDPIETMTSGDFVKTGVNRYLRMKEQKAGTYGPTMEPQLSQTPEEAEAETQIRQIGKKLAFKGNTGDDGVIKMGLVDGKMCFIPEESGTTEDKYSVVYDADELKQNGFDFNKVTPKMVKPEQISETKDVNFDQWVSDELEQFRDTQTVLQNEKVKADSPYQQGQDIQYQGKGWIVLDVDQDGSLIIGETDKDGTVTSNVDKIAPQDFNKIADNTPQAMSQTEGETPAAVEHQPEQPVPEQSAQQKPQARNITDGRNDFTITPQEDGNYIVDQVFNTAKQAETTKNKLAELYPKLQWSVQVTDSGDDFTPDQYRIQASKVQKSEPVAQVLAQEETTVTPEEEQQMSPEVDETANGRNVGQNATQENAMPPVEEKPAEVVSEVQSQSPEVTKDNYQDADYALNDAIKAAGQGDIAKAEKIKELYKDEFGKEDIVEIDSRIDAHKTKVALTAANDQVEARPTKDQKKAGNYKKGHVKIQGLDISIENPVGTVRSGVDKNGKKWGILLNNSYGYFRRTTGKDGDQVDCFIGDHPESQMVYVVDQVNPDTGKFDEHKVMIGFTGKEEAKEAYYSNYEPGWKGFGDITTMSMPEFKRWLGDGTRTKKPAAKFNPGEGAKELKVKTSKQLSPADQKRLSREPQSFEEAVCQFYLSGGRISMEDYYTHFGHNNSERLKNIWMYSKEGVKLDKLNEVPIFASHPELLNGMTGAMDMENAFADVLRGLSGPKGIRQKLDDLQQTKPEELPQETPEETEQTEQEKDSETLDYLLDPALKESEFISIFEDASDENGNIDFPAIAKKIDEEPGIFTQFPWGLNENQLSELKNITQDGNRQRIIQEKIGSIIDTQGRGQGYDLPGRTSVIRSGSSRESGSEGGTTEQPAEPESGRTEVIPAEESQFAGEFLEQPKSEEKPAEIQSEQPEPEKPSESVDKLPEQISIFKNLVTAETAADEMQSRILELRKVEQPTKVQTQELLQNKLAYENLYDKVNKLREQVSNDVIPEDKQNEIRKLIRENIAQNNALNDRIKRLQSDRNAKEKSLQKRNELLGDRKIEEERQAGMQNMFAGDVLFAPNSENLQSALKPFNDGIQKAEEEIQRNNQLLDEKIDLVIKVTQGELNLNNERPEEKPIEEQTPLEQEETETNEKPMSEHDARAEKLEMARSEGEINRILDFGEKIGGARKDEGIVRSESRKGVERNPTWRKGWEVIKQEDGTFRAFKTAGPGSRFIVFEFKQSFKTIDEANLAIKLAYIGHKFAVITDNSNKYEVVRKVAERKRQTMKGGFDTRDDAYRWLIDNADNLVNYKPLFPERPHIDKIERTGPEYRKGNITTSQFQETFGFTGGEFGNWVPQDERQRILNYAYDGLSDLAHIIGVPPKALSLNGQLSIAFGARGQGLSKANAHYERSRAVFNLTRINGAGSVAHEWFHALDHYLGTLDKGTSLEKDENGFVKTKDRDDAFLSHGHRYQTKSRPELINAFNDVLKTIFKQPKIVEVSLDRFSTRIESGTKEVENKIKHIKDYLTRQRDYGHKKAPATPEQAKELESLFKRIQNNDLGGQTNIETKARFGSLPTYEVYKKLNDLFIAITGRGAYKYDNGQKVGSIAELEHYVRNLNDAKANFEKYSKDNKEERSTPTRYYYDAKDIDNLRASNYWSTEHEMMARAFESYIEDKLDANNQLSQYLVHSTHNSAYKALFDLNPYPEGIERERIDEAFDNLFKTIQTKESDAGRVPMFRLTDNDLATINQNFNDELDRQINGTLSKGHIYQLGSPSDALLSSGVKDLPIEMAASTLKLKSSKEYKSDHPFNLSEIKNLPQAIQKPIAIFDSEEIKSPDRRVILTELKSTNGNFLAILDLVNKGRKNEVNSIISLYPKNSAVHVGKWFDSEANFGRNLLRWVDKTKTSQWLSGNSSYVNSAGLSSRRIAKIVNDFQNASISPENNDLHPGTEGLLFRLDDNVYFSPTQRALDDIKQDKGTVEQFKAMLLKGGAKLPELNWMGWDDHFGTNTHNLKQQQLLIILRTNPMWDDIHTGIRTVDDIKTAEEAFKEFLIDDEGATPDFTANDMRQALKSGFIDIYSSKPINEGTFVSPSEMEAKSYSGNGHVYSKKVPLKDVAWISQFEGQYAPAKTTITKKDIQDWINKNKIDIEEVVIEDKNTAKIRSVNGGFAMVYEDGTLMDGELFDSYDEAKEYYAPMYTDVDQGTKYKKYTLPGGMDYKEILFKMPFQKGSLPDGIISKAEAMDLWQRNVPVYGIDDKGIWGEIDRPDDMEYFDYFSDKPENMDEISNAIINNKNASKPFQSGHWDEQNVLAHARINSRATSDGKPVLFIEEIQSDWAQKGKREGFIDKSKQITELPSEWEAIHLDNGDWMVVEKNNPSHWIAAPKRGNNTKEGAIKSAIDYYNHSKNYAGSVPQMPFKQTEEWAGLVFRRMIRYAIDNGFDVVAWTPGEIQNERYDLSTVIDYIRHSKNGDGTYNMYVQKKGGEALYDKVNVPEPELENMVGKELASKIINREGAIDEEDAIRKSILEKGRATEAFERDGKWFVKYSSGQEKGTWISKKDAEEYIQKHNDNYFSGESDAPRDLSGLDLKVGGEGMKGFYDKIIPSIANKIGRKFGSAVQEAEVYTDYKNAYSISNYPDGSVVTDEKGEVVDWFENREDAQNFVDNIKSDTIKVHALPITDAMFNSYKQGIPIFRNENEKITSLEDLTSDDNSIKIRKMRGNIELLASRLNTPIQIHDDRSDLSSDVLTYIKNKGYDNRRIPGFVDPEGNVHIILSECKNIDDAISTILHEIVAHKGLPMLLGDNYSDLLDDIYSSMSQEEISRFERLYNTTNKKTIADEYLGHMAEDNVNPSLFQRIIAKLRQLFRRLFKINFSKNDIYSLLRKSRENLEKQSYPKGSDYDTAEEYLNAITAWHGSGAKFKKFSESKIGSGEGLVLKGYGLYFTDAKEVAKEYALKLAERNKYLRMATREIGETGSEWVKKALVKGRGDRMAALDYLNSIYENSIPGTDIYSKVDDAINFMNVHPAPKNRYLYEVLLAKEKTPAELTLISDEDPVTDMQAAMVSKQMAEDNIDSAPIELALWSQVSGDHLYDMLTRQFGSAKDASEFLSRAGIDGMKYKTSSGAQNYLVFNDKNIQVKERYSFRLADDQEEDKTTLQTASEAYKNKKIKRTTKETLQGIQEYIQDMSLPIENFEKEVLLRGGKQDNSSKPYRDMSLSFGRMEHLYKEFSDDKMSPVFKTVSKLIKAGIPGEQILPYAICKHSLERNPLFRSREIEKWNESEANKIKSERTAYISAHKKPDVREMATWDFERKMQFDNDRKEFIDALKDKDYSGVMSFDPDGNFDSPDKLARTIVDEFESKAPKELVDELWQNINKASDAILDTWVLGSQLSLEKAEEIRKQFNYYLPLRGWREGAAKNLVYTRGEGFSRSFRHAEGRKSLAENPFAHLLSVEFQAISEQVDNEVKNSMLNLIIKNLGNNEIHSMATLKKLYYVRIDLPDGSIEWEPTTVKPASEMFEDGRAKTKIYNEYERLRTPAQAREHEVTVRKPGGDMVMVFIGKNLSVAQAMNKQNYMYRSIFGNVKDAREVNKTFSWIGDLNNMIKAAYTSWNLVFPFTNFMRDMQEASVTQSIKDGSGAKVLANYRKSFPAIIRYISGHQDPSNDTDRMLKRFYEVGGATGYTHSKSIQEIEKEVNKKIRRIVREGTITGKMENGMSNILHTIECWNTVFEDATRFSVYLSSLEKGKTEEEAAYDAKEASVNFNTKGKGSKAWDSVFAFFNVGVQSLEKNIGLARQHPSKFGIYAAAFALAGVLEAMMNAATDDPDDPDSSYYNIGAYMRQNYLVIPNLYRLLSGKNKGDKYLSIPLPQFWRGFKSMGTIGYDVVTGRTGLGEGMNTALANFGSSLLPIDIGGFYQNGEFSLAPLVPTVIKPIYEVAVNRNYMGFQVAKEPFTAEQRKYLANAGLGKNNVNPAAKFLTDMLFRWGGGDNATKYYYQNGEKKKVSPLLDINPSWIEHLFKGYTGGTGGFVSDLMTTISQTLNPDEEIDFKNVPFVNKFIRQTPEAKWNIISRYYNLKDEVSGYENLVKVYGSQANASGNPDKINEITNDVFNQECLAVFSEFDKEISKLYKERTIDDSRTTDETVMLMNECIQEINDLKAKYNKK